MRKKTFVKYYELFADIKNSGLTISQYCSEHNLDAHNIYRIIYNIRNRPNQDCLEKKLVELYNSLSNTDNKTVASVEDRDTDDASETSYERDENGNIVYYKYKIYRKNKRPLCGRLTCEEMESIYRLYTYEGDNLTARSVSRYFSDLSLVDLKRIIKAFHLFKDSCPFPIHMIEKYNEEELREIQLREKENSFMRKAEEDRIKNNEKLLRKYAQENIELKEKLESFTEFNITYPDNITPVKIKEEGETDKDLTIYLADMHLGSMCVPQSIYKENIDYGFEEAKRRLDEVLKRMGQLGCVDTLNIVLMGDNMDCCGFFGKTASLTHDMPENMQPREQANKFIELMLCFIDSIVSSYYCSKIRLFSVPEGNHTGQFEYLCNKALFAIVNTKYPDIETTLWEEFYGTFKQGSHTFICCHGKPSQFAKHGFPLNLDNKTQVLLYEWLEDNNIHGQNIHIVKGDLHSNNLSSCKRFDYRNVLSLYGSSDYSNMNYSRNAFGVSYDLFISDNIIRGTFENL